MCFWKTKALSSASRFFLMLLYPFYLSIVPNNSLSHSVNSISFTNVEMIKVDRKTGAIYQWLYMARFFSKWIDRPLVRKYWNCEVLKVTKKICPPKSFSMIAQFIRIGTGDVPTKEIAIRLCVVDNARTNDPCWPYY